MKLVVLALEDEADVGDLLAAAELAHVPWVERAAGDEWIHHPGLSVRLGADLTREIGEAIRARQPKKDPPA